MKTLTKKFADVVGFGLGRLAQDMEITDDQEAVRFCLENEGFYFQTHEIHYAFMDGREYHTDPENHSERRYVGIPALYTAAELISPLEKLYVQALVLNDEFSEDRREKLKEAIISLKKERPDARYIDEPDTQNEYIRLNPGDMVYDLHGKQMWPPAPAPANTPQPH